MCVCQFEGVLRVCSCLCLLRCVVFCVCVVCVARRAFATRKSSPKPNPNALEVALVSACWKAVLDSLPRYLWNTSLTFGALWRCGLPRSTFFLARCLTFGACASLNVWLEVVSSWLSPSGPSPIFRGIWPSAAPVALLPTRPTRRLRTRTRSRSR